MVHDRGRDDAGGDDCATACRFLDFGVSSERGVGLAIESGADQASRSAYLIDNHGIASRAAFPAPEPAIEVEHLGLVPRR